MRCFAIPVSRLLRIVQNISFCSHHVLAQVETEDVVLGADKDELLSALPTHQAFKVYHVLVSFSVYKNHETIGISDFFFCKKKRDALLKAISPALQRTLRTPVSLPFRDRLKPFSSWPWNCQAPPSTMHSPLVLL